MTNLTSDATKRVATLQKQIDLQFSDFKEHGYNLFAVFIHLGGINSGHYWIFIHDFKEQIWRKYNDGYVTEVGEEEVFSAGDPSRPSTSTFVVYVKAGMEETLTQTICRDIKDETKEMSTDEIGELPAAETPQNWSQQFKKGHDEAFMEY